MKWDSRLLYVVFTLDWNFALLPEVCSKEDVFPLSLLEAEGAAYSSEDGALTEAPALVPPRGSLMSRGAIFTPDLEGSLVLASYSTPLTRCPRTSN